MGEKWRKSRDIIKLADETAKKMAIAEKMAEENYERFESLISWFLDEMVSTKPIDLGADLPIPNDAFIRFHIIEPFETPLAIFALQLSLAKFYSKIKMGLEDLIKILYKGEIGELVIEVPRLLEIGPSMIAKTIKLRPIVLGEWVTGYLSSILNDSAMKELDPANHVHVSLMVSFVHDKRKPINNMYQAIYSKTRRMKTPKCERAPAFDTPPPAWLPSSVYVRSCTYVCHEELDFRKYETYLTMMTYSDGILHSFLIQVDGVKSVVINTLREIDNVFTNQMFNLMHPLFPFESHVGMLPIYWAISGGVEHGR